MNAAKSAHPDGPRGVVAPGRSAKLTSMLKPGERVLWTGGPDIRATLRTQLGLWWIGIPWTAAAAVSIVWRLLPPDWDYPIAAIGVAILIAPILLAFHAAGTIYALTDRRAILKHDALGKREIVSVDFADMDADIAILPTGQQTGHLYFASNMPTRMPDADFDGRLGFRHLRRPEQVRDLLLRVRAHGAGAR